MRDNESISRERRLIEALTHLSNNWWVRHYKGHSGDSGLEMALNEADSILSEISKASAVHPCVRGEKSVRGLPIIDALFAHCSANVGEDAYIRVYPQDAREIVARFPPQASSGSQGSG